MCSCDILNSLGGFSDIEISDSNRLQSIQTPPKQSPFVPTTTGPPHSQAPAPSPAPAAHHQMIHPESIGKSISSPGVQHGNGTRAVRFLPRGYMIQCRTGQCTGSHSCADRGLVGAARFQLGDIVNVFSRGFASWGCRATGGSRLLDG